MLIAYAMLIAQLNTPTRAHNWVTSGLTGPERPQAPEAFKAGTGRWRM
jgi:hypothetical protein